MLAISLEATARRHSRRSAGVRRANSSAGIRNARWTRAARSTARSSGSQRQTGCTQKDGAIWFRATEFGDEKDRVVVRENGQRTYFASDIAYHLDKRERGFERADRRARRRSSRLHRARARRPCGHGRAGATAWK